MRAIILALAMVCLVTPSLAEPPASPPPAIVIGGDEPPSSVFERCVEVEVGGTTTYNCLNERLGKQVERINPVANIPPIDAHSADIRIGVVSIPGVRQQYGQNFGISVIPYRPARPIFSSPGGPLTP